MSHLFKRAFDVREYLLVCLKFQKNGPELVNAFDASDDWMLSYCTFSSGDDMNGEYLEWICDNPLRVYWDNQDFLNICIARREVMESKVGQPVIFFPFRPSVLVTHDAHEAAAFIKNYVKKSLNI
jgi:hypothetical protein